MERTHTKVILSKRRESRLVCRQASSEGRHHSFVRDVFVLKITMRPWFVALCSLPPKDLVLITNVEQNKFYEQLKVRIQDLIKIPGVKLAGTVYDQELLTFSVRMLSLFPWSWGGGTNPSLLEALSSLNSTSCWCWFQPRSWWRGALIGRKRSIGTCHDQAERLTLKPSHLNEKIKPTDRRSLHWKDCRRLREYLAVRKCRKY